jgi:exopolysaccharide biosynthesis operon protein EpsL
MRFLIIPALAFASLQCWAQQDTPLVLNASYAVQTDSNLFRLPSGTDTQTLIGRSSAAEQIGAATLGLRFATTQSLQKFEFNASIVDYRYQNFDYLNFVATNYDAAWRWALTPQFTGSVTSERTETLNSFADFQGFRTRNQRTDTSHRFDSVYELQGPWRLLGGVEQTERSNEQALVAGGDYRFNSVNLGVRHDFGSGTTISLLGRTNSGVYLNQSVPNTGLVDDNFRQSETEFRLHWVYSASALFDTYFTPLSRSHPTYSQRDFSGYNAGASLGWALSGKTRLNAQYSRQLDAYATGNSNYSQTDALRTGLQWSVGNKTTLAANYAVSKIEYLGSPTAVPTSQRKDTLNESSLSLTWEALRGLTVGTSASLSSRSSNQVGLDYESTGISLSAQYSY